MELYYTNDHGRVANLDLQLHEVCIQLVSLLIR